jgi:hypothetical protein
MSELASAEWPFSGLTNAEIERLDMLSEEAAEIIVAVSKIKRHGPYSYNPDKPDDGDNAAQLNSEISDLFGVLLGMAEAGDPFHVGSIAQHRAAWTKKLRYSHHQENARAHVS